MEQFDVAIVGAGPTGLACGIELKRRGIQFEFQDHEISHSIYFRDIDGHQLEITTYQT